VADPGFAKGDGPYMASAERDAITEVWDGARRGVQRPPASGGRIRGQRPLKLKAFCVFHTKEGAKVKDLNETI